MRPGNPAAYECSGGSGGIHSWKRTANGAQCQNCKQELSAADAGEVFADSATPHRPALAVGQIWREVDRRKERFVRVTRIGETSKNPVIITVIKVEGCWVPAPRARECFTERRRFSGRYDGFEYVETPESAP